MNSSTLKFAGLALMVWLAGCVTTGGSSVDRKKMANDKDAALYNMQLGIDYMRRGKLDLAKEKLTRAHQQNPQSPEVNTAIALLYEQLGETSKADQHYRDALRLKPDSAAVLNNYGVFLCRQGKPDKAEKYFLKAVRDPLYRTPEAAYTNMGVCLRQAGDSVRAEENFRRALGSNPRFADALWQMANVAYDQENFLQARAFLQRYSEVGPEAPEVLWLALRVEKALGDESAVRKYAEQLKQDYPESVQTRLLLESERNAG